ncbi:hypothetical protein LIER_01085 [Lithospermum erythrorhizon]|uniref:Uncharacterized protein n=1 Tax=Lithospermum erythrorhizon TaxID=34254 RepID=A0AAV3NJM3_LITER
MTEARSSPLTPPNPPQEAPLSPHTYDTTETSKALSWAAYESLLTLLSESEIEKMKGSNGSLIMLEFSRLGIQVTSLPLLTTFFFLPRYLIVLFFCYRQPHRPRPLRNTVLPKMMKRIRSPAILGYQELHRSATYAQQVEEAREDRDAALLVAQMAEAEVERPTGLVVDLRSKRISAGLPLSWSTVGPILTEFVLNFQEQIPSLPSLLETYKQRFPRGQLEGVPPFLLPSSYKSLHD